MSGRGRSARLYAMEGVKKLSNIGNLSDKEQNALPYPNIDEYNGEVWEHQKTKHGWKDIFVCPALDTVIVAIDIIMGDTIYIITNHHGNQVQLHPSQIFANPVVSLADYGFLVNGINSGAFYQYLSNLVSNAEQVCSYNLLGFYEYNGQTCFLWDKIYYNEYSDNGLYNGSINIQHKGNIKAWRNGIKKLVQGYSPLELVMSCAFAALLMGLLGKERSIDSTVIDFWGLSSTGKSSAMKLAASPYGSPNISDGSVYESCFFTDNALVGSMANLFGILRIFDDTSSSIVRDFESIIYLISNGKDKGRLNGDMKVTNSATWRTIVLTTGESPILDDIAKAGASVRAIEFNLKLTESAEQAQKINDFTNSNYGTAVAYFARKLLLLGKDSVIDFYDTVYKSLLDEMNDKPFNERLCKVYTLIVLACNLINDFFKLSFDVDAVKKLIFAANDNRKTQADLYEDVLDKLLAELSIRQKEIIFVDEFETYIKNGDGISYDKAFRTPQSVIGVCDMRKCRMEFYVNRTVVDEILMKHLGNKKSSVNSAYRYFKDKEYINTYSTGFSVKRKIGTGGRVPCICFTPKIFFDGRQYNSKKVTPSVALKKFCKSFNPKGG